MMREDWITVELKEVCEIYSGTGFPKKYQGLKEGKYPFYKVGDISKNVQNGFRILKWSDNYIDEETLLNIKGKILPKDCIVFAKIGEALKLNRRAITSSDCLIDNNAMGIKANNDFISTSYLYYFFLQVKLEDYSRATTVPSVRKTDIESIRLRLASLSEQRAIVDKIDQLFSELDNGIADLQKAKEKLEIYRQAVLKKAFEGEFTDTNNIEWVTLNDVCFDVEYGTSSKSESDGLVPVLRMGNIQNGQIDWEDLKFSSNKAEIEKYSLNKDDVLFNRTNSPEHVGKTAIFKGEQEAIFAGYLIRINYDKEIVNGNYLNYYLNSHIAKKHGNIVKSFGVNQSNINGTKLKGYPFPKTSLEEQGEIVYEIETRLSVCDSILRSLEDDLKKAEVLRQSILKKAFEGMLLDEEELEACREQVDWEPAENLLRGIKQERDEEV